MRSFMLMGKDSDVLLESPITMENKCQRVGGMCRFEIDWRWCR